MRELFYALIWAVVTGVYTQEKLHRAVCLRSMHPIAYEFHSVVKNHKNKRGKGVCQTEVSEAMLDLRATVGCSGFLSERDGQPSEGSEQVKGVEITWEG